MSFAHRVESLAIQATGQTVFNNLHNLVYTNGTGPLASLIVSGNTLYGTTHNYGGGLGGGSGCVFRMNTDGSGFTNLHTFSGIAPDAGYLSGDLVLSGGTLYGTAAFGGDLDHGCVFAIGTNGLGLTNLYNFSTNLSIDQLRWGLSVGGDDSGRATPCTEQRTEAARMEREHCSR